MSLLRMRLVITLLTISIIFNTVFPFGNVYALPIEVQDVLITEDNTTSVSSIKHNVELDFVNDEVKETIEVVAIRKTTICLSDDGLKNFNFADIPGGRVFQVDKQEFENERRMVQSEYEGKTCYIYKEDFNEIVGPEEDIVATISILKEKYETEAKHIIYVMPAEKYYSVNGSTLDYKYQDYIYSLCLYWGIKDYFPKLLCQFYHESRYDQNAVSSTNDYGICQLNGKYHEGFKRHVGYPNWDLIEDPYANIYVGVWLMARNIRNRNGDFDIAMTDYNAGGGYYSKYGIRESYCNRVNSLYQYCLEEVDPSSNA